MIIHRPIIWWTTFLTFLEWQAITINSASTLECHRRLYTYRAVQSDHKGLKCWDNISVMSCWGRCDSNEISDWRFPYKRSHHPVCIHSNRRPMLSILRNCEDGIAPGTDRYEYFEATECKCQYCSSSNAACEGVKLRSDKEDPFSAVFDMDEYFDSNEIN